MEAVAQTFLRQVTPLGKGAARMDDSGKYADAEPVYNKALTVREAVLGPKHPDTAQSYNYLAACLDANGKSQNAEPLHRKALAIREELLGSKHPDTAQSYNNLAFNLNAQGKARDAEAFFRKALAIWEEVLGPKQWEIMVNDIRNPGRIVP